MLLGAVAIIVYLVRSGLAQQYEGLGAALCAVAVGLFLVWHTIHFFAEQDAAEEQNEATVLAERLNAADKETSSAAPSSESGQNFK